MAFFDFPLLAHFIRAAHALVALAGMAVAVRADADRLQLAVVLLIVMAAGSHGAVNGLVVHCNSLQIKNRAIARPYDLHGAQKYARRTWHFLFHQALARPLK